MTGLNEIVRREYPSGRERVLLATDALVEAPNFSPDGAILYFNSRGSLFRMPAEGGRAERVDTGFAKKLNNDHGISPDGRYLALSDSTQTGKSCIYLVDAGGGEPRRLTAEVPSWWHGWSPDSAAIAYTAVRGGEFCICICDIGQGRETRMIGGPGHYDGPDFTPDGEWIWFNSDRGGSMQLWRMRIDGSAARAMTADERVNWFPHPSPDGKTILYLSYGPGVAGHPRDLDVELRAMPAGGGKPETLVALFGGQGTINVPPWSPDSATFAYVRYGRTDSGANSEESR